MSASGPALRAGIRKVGEGESGIESRVRRRGAKREPFGEEGTATDIAALLRQLFRAFTLEIQTYVTIMVALRIPTASKGASNYEDSSSS